MLVLPVLVLAVLVLAVLTGASGTALGEPAVRRGACEPVAYEQDPAAATSDDDEEADDSATADNASIGVAHGEDGCATISGSLAAIGTHTRPRLDSPVLQALGGAPFSTLQLGGTATLTTARTVGGVFVGSTVSVIGFTHPVPQLLFAEASLRIDRLQFGYGLSRFSFWSVDLFTSSLLSAGRTTAFLAFDLVRPRPWSLTLVLEDPNLPGAGTADVPPLLPGFQPQPYAPRKVPDIILRTRYETDALSLHLAGAIRPQHASEATGPGFAFTIGGSWSFTLAGVAQTVSGQAMFASDMPTYLGTNFEARTVRSLIRPGDRTYGASGVLSWQQDWTPQWSTGLIASHIVIAFPGLGPTGGSFVSTRVGANITYRPLPSTRVSLELAQAWSRVNLPDRLLPLVQTSGRATVVTLATAVSF
ncbi:MAG: hypothetical protein ACK4M0_02695 [Phreatobacter sp.]